jgi:hypothetical protein
MGARPTPKFPHRERHQDLHRQMFSDVWRWAGRTQPPDELLGNFDGLACPARRYPFPNGNGRHARLLADLLIMQLGGQRFSWGSNCLPGQARYGFHSVRVRVMALRMVSSLRMEATRASGAALIAECASLALATDDRVRFVRGGECPASQPSRRARLSVTIILGNPTLAVVFRPNSKKVRSLGMFHASRRKISSH